MAIVKNPWVGYLDRNFQKIKNRILTRLGQTIPEVSDHSDSNILVVVIESFSGVIEMINYYIDNMAREAFLTTARKYSSVVKHTRLIDYRIKAKIPASVDLTIYFLDNQGVTLNAPNDFTIPSGTVFYTNNGVQFINTNDILVEAGSSSVKIPTKQKTAVVGENLGITTDSPNQTFSLGKNYVHNSVNITINGEPWVLKDTLGRSEPESNDYIVDVSAAQEAYIQFGDNINGAIPLPSQNIVANYYESLGSLGNVEINTIINTDYDLSVHNIPNFSLTNTNKASGGSDFENIDRIKRSAPLSLRTLDRAVTRKDYSDLALLAPGVDKANLFFSCGKFVTLYIAPNGGGIASTALLKDVEDFFDDKKMVTTFVKALPAGESNIYIELIVNATFRKDGLQLKNELTELLLEAYSYENSDVNKSIRISDLIALVDNYKYVDFLNLEKLYIKPYPRPVNHTTQLDHTITLNSHVPNMINWKVSFTGSFFNILKDNIQVGNITPGQTFTDNQNTISLTINNGPYQIGQSWTFSTLPINKDQVILDYSVPVLKAENLKITVIEKLSM